MDKHNSGVNLFAGFFAVCLVIIVGVTLGWFIEKREDINAAKTTKAVDSLISSSVSAVTLPEGYRLDSAVPWGDGLVLKVDPVDDRSAPRKHRFIVWHAKTGAAQLVSFEEK